MNNISDLITTLKDASHGNSGLSDIMALALDWNQTIHGDTMRGYLVPRFTTWTAPGGGVGPTTDNWPPRYTESIDAAMTSIPPDWHMGRLFWPGYDEGYLINKVRFDLHHMFSSGGGPMVNCFAATIPLAICISSLLAKEHDEGRVRDDNGEKRSLYVHK